jgi:hypothetical protein
VSLSYSYCSYQFLNITCGVLLNVIALFVYVYCTNNSWNSGVEGQCPIIWRKRVWDTGYSRFLPRMRDCLKFRNNKMTHVFSARDHVSPIISFTSHRHNIRNTGQKSRNNNDLKCFFRFFKVVMFRKLQRLCSRMLE